MRKPLLYAFGGLPIALLGILIALGRGPSGPAEPATTETLTPATSAAPESDAVAINIPPKIKPPPINSAPAADIAATDTPPIKSPEVKVDGSNEPRLPFDASRSDAPAVPKVRTDGSNDRQSTLPAPSAPSADMPGKIPDPPVQDAGAPIMREAEPPMLGGGRMKVAAQDPIAAVETKIGRVLIQRGNTLWRLSRVIYGKGRDFWRIAEANRDIIRDPSLIYPGQVIAIPGAVPPEKISPRRRRPLPPAELGLSITR